MKTIILLTISNIFMTIAWYGHLKFKGAALWIAILASWGIALFEYIFQVPANRIGCAQFTVTQLKILQECITPISSSPTTPRNWYSRTSLWPATAGGVPSSTAKPMR